MKFQIESKFEVGEQVVLPKYYEQPNVVVIDLKVNYSELNGYWKIEYLCEHQDRSRYWYEESKLKSFKEK